MAETYDSNKHPLVEFRNVPDGLGRSEIIQIPLDQAKGLIDGSMMIVPVEPTKEMIMRAHNMVLSPEFWSEGGNGHAKVYKAMINKEGQS